MTNSGVIRRVAGKEMALFFASPVAWLFLAGFAAASLFIVFWAESFFARNIADARPLFEWMPLLLIFLCSALTMRMWSEERRSGTLEHVLVQPTPLWHFVMGKFVACVLLLLLALAATLPLPVTVALIADLDWGPVWAGYLATMLLGAAYLALGLFVSARTDNPVVSLLGSVALCGLLYLLGSDLLTSFFDSEQAETLRLLGSGSRFDSITRGVIDLVDLFYYLTLIAGFLTLNVYTLEKIGWARVANTPRQRHWRAGVMLLLANLLLANALAERWSLPRWDVTEGRLYSISSPSRELLSNLQEPLLIRGYFSARNHPLLAPLEPQLKDLLLEYAEAAGGNVRVEFIDPLEHPELEQEANQRYNIRPSPFQLADRHQTALVNAYFNLLIEYGDEYRVLSFNDLIEVRTSTNGQPEVLLRNPEFEVTRSIRDVLYAYRAGGDLFAGLERPVEFIGYVSDAALLPDALLAYRDSIVAQLQRAVDASDGMFSFRFLDPQADDGELARRIQQDWGFAPMTHALDSERDFYFYMTLADEHQVVQLPTADFDPGQFRKALDAGLRRFARDFTRTVALAAPQPSAQMTQYNLGGPGFANLENAIARDYLIARENLEDGSVSPEADILAVVAPRELGEAAIFAIDQFLMRGGTVILATSPFSVEPEQDALALRDWPQGKLQDWLRHHGIEVANQLVLDRRQARFPAPVQRDSGDHQFQDVRIVDYPYFLDIRGSGLSAHPLLGSLPQLTMAWASPLQLERRAGIRINHLLWSSEEAWLSEDDAITPQQDETWSAPEQTTRHLLGAMLSGRFESYFRTPPALPETAGDGDGIGTLLKRAPGSARIIVFASNDFLSDRVLGAQVRATGTQYLGPIELFSNTLDWSLQDEQLLQIRSRGHFNRTLPPMEPQQRLSLELFNYGAALAWLMLLALASWVLGRRRRARYRRELGL